MSWRTAYDFDMAAALQSAYDWRFRCAFERGDWIEVMFWNQMRCDAYYRVRAAGGWNL